MVWDLGQHMAPRPDGFLLFFFFRVFWILLKGDLVWFLCEVFRGEVRLDMINYSLVTLIPKKIGSKRIEEFRSFPLLNSSLKIVSKILVKRLAPKLHDLIEDYQTDFIAERNILEGLQLHIMSSIDARNPKGMDIC